LGGGGPDPKKLANRTSTVAALKALANSGNVDAWHLLGAMGRRAPLPYAVSLPGLPAYNDQPSGYMSPVWGNDYAGIQQDAGQAYDALAIRFQRGGVGAVPVKGGAGSQPVSIAGAPDAAPGIPWYVWALVALAAVLLVMRGGGKG